MSKLIIITTRLHRVLGLNFYDSVNLDSNSNLLYIWPSFVLTLNLTLLCLFFILTPPDWEKVLLDTSGILICLFQIGSLIHGTLMLFESIFFKDVARELFCQIRAIRQKFQSTIVQESFEKKMKDAVVTHLIQIFISTLQLSLELGYNFFWEPQKWRSEMFIIYYTVVLPVRAFQMPLLMKFVTIYMEMCANLIQHNRFVFDFNFYKEIQSMLNKIYKITEAINKSFGTSLFFSPISIFLSMIVFVYIFGTFGINPEIRESFTGFAMPKFLMDAVMILYMGWNILIASSECERMVRFLFLWN